MKLIRSFKNNNNNNLNIYIYIYILNIFYRIAPFLSDHVTFTLGEFVTIRRRLWKWHACQIEGRGGEINSEWTNKIKISEAWPTIVCASVYLSY